ncbi:hypothetical protein B6I21_02275 [candidate division KSB1 bacterium 4572_119]|nr:MAG: hypothetical protein B6I21_02275 [candidate division KSB1 bacterium 4572_119]
MRYYCKIILNTFVIVLFLTEISTAAKKFDLSNWHGNFSVVGKTPYDYFGYSICSGDINGDDIDDIIIGAYYADPMGRNGGGIVYGFFGNSTFSQDTFLNLSASNADFTIYGPSNNSQLGRSVAIGNFNNDIYDDIIISAPYHSENGIQSRGAVYILNGSSTISGIYDMGAGSYDGIILGEKADDQIGFSLLSIDINNDSYDEILVGAPYADYEYNLNCGKVYVFWGQAQ